MNRFAHRIGRRGLLGGAGALLAMPAIAQTAQTTLRFATLYTPQHSANRSSQWFADEVSKQTDGKLHIQVYPNAVLGNEDEAVQGVRNGTIDICYGGVVGFGGYVRDIRVLELPYLYSDLDQLAQVANNVAPIIDTLYSNVGLKRLSFQFDGPRMTLATRPLRSFADFKGLKMRVPQSPVYIEMVKAFGAIPTPIALPEAYTALQAHVADAIEGSATSMYTSKYYEVARNLVRTDHIFFTSYVAINPGVFGRLPAEWQKILVDTGNRATDYNLQISKAASQADLAQLVKVSQSVSTPDREPFKKAVQVPNEKYAASLGGRAMELYKQVQAVTGH
ncbi:MAG TPA: TRAP transporter substrate-binding protein [Acetobacteraceae bacterium]